MALIAALGRLREAELCELRGQPALQCEFQDGQGYIKKKLCLKANQNKPLPSLPSTQTNTKNTKYTTVPCVMIYSVSETGFHSVVQARLIRHLPASSSNEAQFTGMDQCAHSTPSFFCVPGLVLNSSAPVVPHFSLLGR